MQKLSYLIFAAIIAFSFSSCKKEGCTDPLALNYDEDATKNNNDCDYSTVSFYASGDTHNGTEVLEIVIRIDEIADPIGAITTFNQSFPTDCAVAGTVNYKIETGDSHTWFAKYNLVADGVAFEQGNFSPSRSKTCIQIDVLP